MCLQSSDVGKQYCRLLQVDTSIRPVECYYGTIREMGSEGQTISFDFCPGLSPRGLRYEFKGYDSSKQYSVQVCARNRQGQSCSLSATITPPTDPPSPATTTATITPPTDLPPATTASPNSTSPFTAAVPLIVPLHLSQQPPLIAPLHLSQQPPLIAPLHLSQQPLKDSLVNRSHLSCSLRRIDHQEQDRKMDLLRKKR